MDDIRIIVEGSRGKSGIVRAITEIINSRGHSVVGKITGKEPVVLLNGVDYPIVRKGNSFLLDHENKALLMKYSSPRFKVFENQALSIYTMEVIHNIFQPDIIVIPNIRFEHQNTLGQNLKEISRSFAFNFKGAKKVITTENKEVVLRIFREYCKRYGIELIIVDDKEEIPSISSIRLIERVLYEVGLGRLSKEEKVFLEKKIKDSLSIRYSFGEEIHYFNGAKINDIESSTKVFDYIKRNNKNKKFVFLCYLRKDRPERTEAFAPFFDMLKNDPSVKKVYFTGSGLKQINKNNKFVSDGKLSCKKVLDYCRENECVLYTAVNGANDYMRKIDFILSR